MTNSMPTWDNWDITLKKKNDIKLVFIIERFHLYKSTYSWKFTYQYSCHFLGHPLTCAEQWRIWVPQCTHFQVIVEKVILDLLLVPHSNGQWTTQGNTSHVCRGQLNRTWTPVLTPVSGVISVESCNTSEQNFLFCIRNKSDSTRMSHLQNLGLLPCEAWFSSPRLMILSMYCTAMTIFLMRGGIYLVSRLFYGLKGCTSSWEGWRK